jgi:hypothetical protein
MPYEIKHVKGGYLVCDEKRCFSKKPITKKKAQKQRVAIAISEHKKNPEIPMKTYFV